MIELNRLNNEPFYVNEDRIEYIEATPDTVICFESGRKVIVAETPEEVIQKILSFRQLVRKDPSKKILTNRGEEHCHS